MSADLPDWLQPLAAAAATVRPDHLTKHLPLDRLPPTDGSGRASAVLIAFCELGSGPAVLLIQRSADLRDHAGQVAFPGGAVDPDDADATAAALREATEEVGLDPAGVVVFGTLPDVFIPVTGFVVTPVLAWWRDPHPVSPMDAVEVARCEVVPVADLVEPANRFRVRHPSGLVGPGFDVAGLFVWGFTAGLLDSVLSLAGWNLPWDATRERDLPAGLLGRRS